jgi:hypothetical protein
MESLEHGLERDIPKTKYNWGLDRSLPDPWRREMYHVEEGQHRPECNVVENTVNLAFLDRSWQVLTYAVASFWYLH